tara:strand:- start:11 stop:436 length:426 start_codon:yes stop_codon:yes gene_type:complete
LVVRTFIENDRQALRQVYYESRRDTFQWLDAASLKLSDFDRDTIGESIWVAEFEGSIAGFVSVDRHDNFIHNLFVLTKCLDQGIGSLLLATALANIGRPARLKCVVENSRAISFYKAKGWIETGTGVSEDGIYHVLETKPP